MTLAPGWSKVRHVPSGLIYERHAADAHELVATHPETFAAIVDENPPCIREHLEAMEGPALRSFAMAAGVPAPDTAPLAHVTAQLVPLIESGAVALPAAS